MYKLKNIEDCETAVKIGLQGTGYALTGEATQESSTENIGLTIQSGEQKALIVVHATALEWNGQANVERLTAAAVEYLRNELSEHPLRSTRIHL